MNRTTGSLTIRSIDEDQRIIEGIASTSEVDRMGDIVLPKGAKFQLPLPFLLDHRQEDVVGQVEYAEVTGTGIRFRARIPKVAQPGPAKDLVDKAWSLIKAGLRRSVSIGFIPLQSEPLPGGGRRFTSWEWIELSAVGVPANAGAQITATRQAKSRGHVVRLGKSAGRPNAIVRLSEAELSRGRSKVRGPVKLHAPNEAKAAELLRSGERLLAAINERSARRARK